MRYTIDVAFAPDQSEEAWFKKLIEICLSDSDEFVIEKSEISPNKRSWGDAL